MLSSMTETLLVLECLWMRLPIHMGALMIKASPPPPRINAGLTHRPNQQNMSRVETS